MHFGSRLRLLLLLLLEEEEEEEDDDDGEEEADRIIASRKTRHAVRMTMVFVMI